MTIKRKLFLAFLLLAFLPTSGLIWLSYYLATEGSKLVAAPGVSETLAAGDSLAMWALAQEQERLTADLSIPEAMRLLAKLEKKPALVLSHWDVLEELIMA